ncbi:Shikimate kinase/Threonine synthase-like 1 [Moorella glycerini]|uniref:Shikimate kinase n=1 Tax=Neomoorella stamsii TaxID=1266720 RepID=A0A9X7P7U5_9FIRM|nr:MULTISPECIES: shikimate kinase [Moorella]PRR77754.1 Shikimate kinase [Moorella stamsii]CEP66029.1 Shikimate kinase/Threonine synthase-like 1 [Moorella glycerini]
MPDNIVLIGFMGSGKTTAGKILAASLGWSFVDTDAMIEEDAGLSIKEIFARYGEQYFRELEQAAVAQAAASRGAVIATGGGAVLSGDNVRRLREGNKVVWLQVRLETALQRAGVTGDRPLLQERRREEVAELFKRREPYYTFADVYIDTDGKDAAAVAGEIKEALKLWLASLK